MRNLRGKGVSWLVGQRWIEHGEDWPASIRIAWVDPISARSRKYNDVSRMIFANENYDIIYETKCSNFTSRQDHDVMYERYTVIGSRG